MTKKKKRICAFLAAACLSSAFSGTSLLQARAAAQKEQAVYAAFGDSIAAGYGLEGYADGQSDAPKDSYQGLLAGFLQTQSHNYAVSGDDSNACIDILNSGKADEDLQHADIITLSIGSNDLLLPFIQIVMEYFGLEPGTIDAAAVQEQLENGITMPQLSMSDLLKYYQQSEQLLASLEDNTILHEKAAAFPQQLETILSILREKAPDARIYVTNIYNPFTSIPKIGEMAEVYISEINQAFSADDPDYALADVYTPFQQENLTNISFDANPQNLASFQPDPHPSVKGHKAIADLLIAAVKQDNAPKPASVISVSSSAKKKLTVKARIPANADGYQVRYASSKNGTYQTLAASGNKTFQSGSGKLKTGKTYYIKLRSFRSVNGVTYYGKNSSVKKIKIK